MLDIKNLFRINMLHNKNIVGMFQKLYYINSFETHVRRPIMNAINNFYFKH